VQQDQLSQLINGLSNEKVRKYLERSFGLSTYDINNFKYTENKKSLPEIDEKLDITVQNYATITGKRLFITPNVLNRAGQQITEDTLRTSDFVFNYAYRDKDQIEIEIPEGYEIESAPKDVSIQTPFGGYQFKSTFEGNKIMYSRTREQFSGRFPASKQKEIIQFFSDIYKADRSRIVLVKSSANK
jgi:hypothetical protein